MPVISQACAAIAAALHVVFFFMESVSFRRVHRRFGVAPGDVEAVRPWAFNQGFYNLFLALGVFAGLAALHADVGLSAGAARAAVLLPCACMFGAGLVLVATDRKLAAAAAAQALPPLVAWAFALAA